MTGTRYVDLFSRLELAGEGAFIPFVTLGDPDHETSRLVLSTLIEAGADALELGIPFSDPVADGPVIQAAASRALAAGATVDRCLSLVREARAAAPELPIGLLVYTNLIWRRGLERFYREVAEVGVDSVLAADLPLEESAPYRAAAEACGIAQVLIVPPNASDARLRAIAAATQGYTYVTTRSGVTGDNGRLDPTLERTLSRLRDEGAPPSVLGFGIKSPTDARNGLVAGAAGVIAGSAIVRLAATHRDDPARMRTELAAFVRSMKRATRPVETPA